jgi:hypothetical protein
MGEQGITRRNVLGGLGVAGASVLPAMGLVLANGADPAAAAPNGAGLGNRSTTPFPFTAFRYTRIPAAGFRPEISPFAYTTVGVTLKAGAAGKFVAPLSPGLGDALVVLDVTLDPAGVAGSITLSRHRPGTDQVLATAAFGATNGVTTVTARPVQPEYAEPDTWSYQVSVDVGMSAVLHDALVSWFAPASQVVLIPPMRLYDTRAAHSYIPLPTSPHQGKVAAGQQIGFSVDPVVPRFIDGVILNVTITETEGAGYVVVWVPDADNTSAPPPNVSSINWSVPDQTLANLVFTRVFEEADVLINVGGAGKTQIVVDVVGYLA